MSTAQKTRPDISTSALPSHVSHLAQKHSPLKSPVRSPHPLRHIVQHSPSRSKVSGEDLSRVDVDELFSRFTVSEVRSLRLKLQADADAQQQDLRLMVGERYRDLLEASTAIVSISDASKRVKSSLEDVKVACNTSSAVHSIQKNNRKRSQSVYGGATKGQGSGQDSQLVTLQVLAAHLKLLLDTPEQIWRLLEQKRYLHAAWLFLLARIVYRTLSTEDVDEEGELEWVKEGIDVMTQFPIVQRQWDVINSFRPQITYRATQSLREQTYNTTPTSGEALKSSSSSALMIAETLLSIHLLDSLPLSDTLSLFLSQRSKTLQTMYTRIQTTPAFSSSLLNSTNSQTISKSRRKNREFTANLLRSPSSMTPSLDLFKLPAVKASDAAEKARKAERDRVVRDVRRSLRQVLELVALTISIIRDTFGNGPNKSLMSVLLGSTPSGVPSWDGCQLSTQQILSSLPSSTLLQRYLPTTVQSYAPYIDTTSPSAHLSLDIVTSTSSAWLKTALQGIQEHFTSWLGMLCNVREIWSVWIGLHSWHDGGFTVASWLDTFTADELAQAMQLIKETCINRVQEVLKDKLIEIEGAVVKEVQKCVELLREGSDNAIWDANPSTFRFSSSQPDNKGLVVMLAASHSVPESKGRLQQRVASRTPLLHSILLRFEQLARDLKDDLSSLEGPNGQTQTIAADLIQQYTPEAESTALNIVTSLREILERENKSSTSQETNLQISVFVGRVALDLATASTFINDLAMGSISAFQLGMHGVHDLALEFWNHHAVEHSLTSYRSFLSVQIPTLVPPFPSAPSRQLMQSLLHLVSEVHRLGMRPDQASLKHPERSLLDSFVGSLLAELRDHFSEDLLFDLMFLRALRGSTVQNDDIDRKLSDAEESMKKHMSSASSSSKYQGLVVGHISNAVPVQLARLQLLLDPFAGVRELHSRGANTSRDRPATQPGATKSFAEQDMKLALNLAKPSARFGLLLVPGTASSMR